MRLPSIIGVTTRRRVALRSLVGSAEKVRSSPTGSFGFCAAHARNKAHAAGHYRPFFLSVEKPAIFTWGNECEITDLQRAGKDKT